MVPSCASLEYRLAYHVGVVSVLRIATFFLFAREHRFSGRKMYQARIILNTETCLSVESVKAAPAVLPYARSLTLNVTNMRCVYPLRQEIAIAYVSEYKRNCMVLLAHAPTALVTRSALFIYLLCLL